MRCHLASKFEIGRLFQLACTRCAAVSSQHSTDSVDRSPRRCSSYQKLAAIVGESGLQGTSPLRQVSQRSMSLSSSRVVAWSGYLHTDLVRSKPAATRPGGSKKIMQRPNPSLYIEPPKLLFPLCFASKGGAQPMARDSSPPPQKN